MQKPTWCLCARQFLGLVQWLYGIHNLLVLNRLNRQHHLETMFAGSCLYTEPPAHILPPDCFNPCKKHKHFQKYHCEKNYWERGKSFMTCTATNHQGVTGHFGLTFWAAIISSIFILQLISWMPLLVLIRPALLCLWLACPDILALTPAIGIPHYPLSTRLCKQSEAGVI